MTTTTTDHHHDLDQLTPSTDSHSRYESQSSSTFSPTTNNRNRYTSESIDSGIVCPSCGNLCAVAPTHLNPDARIRILELEAQLQALSAKASAQAHQLANYEDEFRRMRGERKTSSGWMGGQGQTQMEKEGVTPILTSRISSYFARRGSPNPPLATPENKAMESHHNSLFSSPSSRPPTPSPSQRQTELQAQLSREQDLRTQAEGQLAAMSTEMEELSGTLFSQANEMVATERKARAKLEERVEFLEKKDHEKKLRLDRLDGAIRRIERVRRVLSSPPG